MRAPAASALLILTVLAAGCFGDPAPEGAPTDEDFDEMTCAIAGMVLDEDTDEPLPGKKVVLDGTNRTNETNHGGRFLFPHTSPGTHRVVLWDTSIAEEVACEADQVSDLVTLYTTPPKMPDDPIGHGTSTGSREITVPAPWPPASEGSPEEACSTEQAVDEVHYWEETIRADRERNGNGTWGPTVEVPKEIEVELAWDPTLEDPETLPTFALCLVDPLGNVRQSQLEGDDGLNVTHRFQDENEFGTWYAHVFLTTGAHASATLTTSVMSERWYEAALEPDS